MHQQYFKRFQLTTFSPYGLLTFKYADIDIHPVFNKETSVAYMCAYFTKLGDSCPNAMQQDKYSHYELMKVIARAYGFKKL